MPTLVSKNALLPPVQVYPKGVQLFRQGELLSEVMWLSDGIVKLACAESDGSEAIVGLALSGAWLGAAAVIAGVPTPASLVTCTEVAVSRICADAFRELLRSDAQLSQTIHRAHSIDLCRQVEWMTHLTSLSSRGRLEQALGQFITVSGPKDKRSSVKLRLPLSMWELAGLIGVSPEHLSRLLKQMQTEGVIRRERGWIVVPDVRRLGWKDSCA